MILEIAELVTTHCGVPEPTARHLEVAYLKTTDPTFLVFARHQEHPLFVVKIGRTDDLERRGARLARLHRLLPDAMAKPFGVFPLGSGHAILVQNGLPGLPWFRLGDRYSTPAAWLELRGRAVGQLHRFHDAVATQPDWVFAPSSYDGELLDLAARLATLLTPLGPAIHPSVREAADALAALPVAGLCQHGDFVLNNLLVDDARLGIVDLDDFGKWHAPWIDGFALGLSVHLHASRHVVWHHRAEDLAACQRPPAMGVACTPRQAVAQYLHFLLAAISDTLNRPSRAEVRSFYLECLRDLLADGPRYTSAFERPAGREAHHELR